MSSDSLTADKSSGKIDVEVNQVELQDKHPSSIPTRTKVSVIATVVFSGIALFSDGYNAQVVGYMNPFLTKLYPEAYTDAVQTRMSNAYLIGEIIGMLGFGFLIDRIGRKFGIVACTSLLILVSPRCPLSIGTNTKKQSTGYHHIYCCSWKRR